MKTIIAFLLLFIASAVHAEYRVTFLSYSEHSIATFEGPGERITISWYPRGPRSLLFPQSGMNLDLESSLKRAASFGDPVRNDGTFVIDRRIFESAKAMRLNLERGLIPYKALDCVSVSGGMNCQTAIASCGPHCCIRVAHLSGHQANLAIQRQWNLH